jgi:hypothetical protein
VRTPSSCVNIIGHLLQSRLVSNGVCSTESAFALVWRDHVVPVAAAMRTERQVGMCAEIHGLTTRPGLAFNGILGRIPRQSPDDSDRFELLIDTPDGIMSANLKPSNLKAGARPTAILHLWRAHPLPTCAPSPPRRRRFVPTTIRPRCRSRSSSPCA